MVSILEIAQLQDGYEKLVKDKKLSKKAICDLCVPFRDKAGISDLQTLQIARRELTLSEVLKLCGIDLLFEKTERNDFGEAMVLLNSLYRNSYYELSDPESFMYKIAHAAKTVLPVFEKIIGHENEK